MSVTTTIRGRRRLAVLAAALATVAVAAAPAVASAHATRVTPLNPSERTRIVDALPPSDYAVPSPTRSTPDFRNPGERARALAAQYAAQTTGPPSGAARVERGHPSAAVSSVALAVLTVLVLAALAALAAHRPARRGAPLPPA
jgi:hypothetical protein